jgi:uncharacterized protein (DUF305 family)
LACLMRRGMAALVGAVATVVALGGCTGAPADEVADPSSAPPVILPGGPGDEPRTAAPGLDGAEPPAPNDTDVRYMSMMVPHHRQAIVMTDLVADRASSEQVRAVAARISAAQEAEIARMTEWLTSHGHPVPPDGSSHGHGQHGGMGSEQHSMPGMATPEQLADLRAATGAEFDRQFLTLMIAHHEGAVTMAQEELANGIEMRAQEMAQDVVAGQSAEIERMRDLLGT